MQQRGELRVWWRAESARPCCSPPDCSPPATGTSATTAAVAAAAAAVGAVAYGPTGLHRLSRIEYDNTLADLLGDNTRSGFASLPEDVNDPFDNDFSTQLVSGALIAVRRDAGRGRRGAPARRHRQAQRAGRLHAVGRRRHGLPGELRARVRAARVPAAAHRRRGGRLPRAVGVRRRGQRLLRRRRAGAARVPAGSELPLPRRDRARRSPGKTGLYALGDYEIGDAAVVFPLGLDAVRSPAGHGGVGRAVDATSGRRAAATELLADPRGAERVKQFHAFWLAYDQLPLAADMAAAMRAETDALVARVVFERRGDYFDLFNATRDVRQRHAGDALRADAARAARRAPGSLTARSPRRGILSHGTLLAAGAKFDDTSPTLRGVFVRNRLLCQTIPPPPPTVAVDEPPPATAQPVQGRPLRRPPQRRLRQLPQPDRSDRLRPGELRPHGRLPRRRAGQPAVHDLRRRRGGRSGDVQRPGGAGGR